jgi:integrase
MVESGELGTTLHCLVPLTAGAHVDLPDRDAGTLLVEPTCVAVDGKVIGPDGPPHPDTITRRFKELARRAGLPELGPHDVRHNHATAGNAKAGWKALSKRTGHRGQPARQR